MKSAVSFLGCVTRLIGTRLLLAVAIGVFVLGISFAHAQILPKTATINTYLVCHLSETNKGISPTGDVIDFKNECGPVVADWGTWGKTTYSASSKINYFKFPELAPDGVLLGGKIDGVGTSYMNGYSKNAARGGAGGNLKYYFNIVRVASPPFPMPTIPILFTAVGKGSVEKGHGIISASATVGVWGSALPTYFPSNLFRIVYEGKPYKAGFGDNPDTGQKSVTLDLPVNNPRQPYQVQIASNAVAYSPSVTTLNIKDDSSTVSVYVDSIIRFDQTAFDKKYGSKSFPLGTCYKLEYVK